MTKQQKRALKAQATGRNIDVQQPNPDAPSNALPLDLAPPPDVTGVVVDQPAKDSVKPAKVKTPFVYNRDEINARIAAEKAAGMVRLHPNKARYVKAVASSADQRSVFDNADEVAIALRSVDLAGLWEYAAQHLTPEVIASKQLKYMGKNVGMVRMNIGNLVRGAIRAKARAKLLADAAAEAAKSKVE